MKFNLTNDSNLLIEFSGWNSEMYKAILQYLCFYEKTFFMSEFAALYNNKYMPMAKWFGDVKVPDKDKELYKIGFENVNKIIAAMWQVLIESGMTEKEIKNYIEIPF